MPKRTRNNIQSCTLILQENAFDTNISNEIDNLSTCRNILQKILNNSKTADVTLIAGIDGARVPANRIVLSAASEYFSTMFSVDMMEKNQKEITISEVDGETMQALINYCYSGEIKITAANVLNILSAASLFLFEEIVNECKEHLTEQLTANPELCLNVLKVADTFSFNDLLAKSFEMIGRDFKTLVKSTLFMQLDYSLFERIIQCDERIFAKEEDIFEAAMDWVDYDDKNRVQFVPLT